MALLTRYCLVFVLFVIIAFSTSRFLWASATDADFEQCKSLSVEILQRCLSQSVNSGDPSCWNESQDAFKFCQRRIKKLYDVELNTKRRNAEKEALKERLLESKKSSSNYTDNISITYPDKSKKFLSFLNDNRNQQVVINSLIDVSLSSELSYQIWEQWLIEEYLKDNRSPLPLDGLVGRNLLILKLKGNRLLPVKHGGTGVVQLNISGKFQIKYKQTSPKIKEFILVEI